jgi:hypothetical protein
VPWLCGPRVLWSGSASLRRRVCFSICNSSSVYSPSYSAPPTSLPSTRPFTDDLIQRCEFIMLESVCGTSTETKLASSYSSSSEETAFEDSHNPESIKQSFILLKEYVSPASCHQLRVTSFRRISALDSQVGRSPTLIVITAGSGFFHS